MCHRPGSLSSIIGLLGTQTNGSISLDTGFLLCQKRMIHRLCLDSGVGCTVRSLQSGLCWHKQRFLDRLGGGQETQGKAPQN